MNFIKRIRAFHLTSAALRACGILFLAAGLFGYLMQAKILAASGISNTDLFDALEADSSLMVSATLALAGQALETAAVPVFAFLLAEGAACTSDFGRYFLRVLGISVVCQLPYNLVMTGSLLKIYSLNPAFAAVMSMSMLYFFRRFPGKKVNRMMVKCLAVLFAYLWSNILGISHGAACVLITAVLWGFRGKPNLQTLLGMLTALCCTIFSVFYMASPLSFLLLHFYDGKQGSHHRAVNYAAYPMLLLLFGLLAVFWR